MHEHIELPPTLQGDEKNQLQQVWSYLYQLSEAINNNLDAIGGNDLTDSERMIMQKITTSGGDELVPSEYETLKSLIIKTADFVQTNLQEYRMKLLGETVASGQFGRYVRQTGLDVEVNPEGITQNYSFQEIVQGLKHYEINAKNYIKTGLLRTVSSIPVYGVAIGKDVVTFSQDGTETYNDGNKVAELTADELSFWQNGVKIAGYTGSRISFYYNGTEAFYIQNGKIYAAADLELGAGKKVKIGNWTFEEQKMNYNKDDEKIGFEIKKWENNTNDSASISYLYADESTYKIGEIWISPAECEQENGQDVYKFGHFRFGIQKNSNNTYGKYIAPYIDPNNSIKSYIGTNTAPFDYAMIKQIQANVILPDQNGNLKQIGDSSYPFSSIIANNYKANYIYPDSNGSLKQIGSYTNPFSIIYAEEFAGGHKPQYDSSLTNFNNMKKSGRWYVVMNSMSNGPSDLTIGTVIVDVMKISDSIVHQMIIASGAIYTRQFNSTWGSWYKYAGTAV